MSAINTVMNRMKKCGYDYDQKEFDQNNVPNTIKHKTCFINQHTGASGTSLPMSSIKQAKTFIDAYDVFIIQRKSKTDKDRFQDSLHECMGELLKNRGEDKIQNVAKIDITNNRTGYTDLYFIGLVTVRLIGLL